MATDDPRYLQTRSYRSFKRSKYRSKKHTAYFNVYDTLFDDYVGREIVFVEVGVLSGGSLFMWRDFFGDQARIIGIDLNPNAVKWESEGFEIRIGDQSRPEFWDEFFASVGPIDVLLDDGGHTNRQQIITAQSAIPQLKDGGMCVEDVHWSFMSDFGNPNRHSFYNYAKALADSMYGRSPGIVTPDLFRDRIYSVQFFESIIAFHVDPRKAIQIAPIDNGGEDDEAQDYRFEGATLTSVGSRLLKPLRRIPWLLRFAKWSGRKIGFFFENRYNRCFFRGARP